MSILIKGAKMPKCCFECVERCVTFEGESCRVTKELIYDISIRPVSCPLVEIPPHGELIDKGTLMESTKETYCTPCPHDGDYNYCKACLIDDALDAIEDVPTVIESEEQENE